MFLFSNDKEIIFKITNAVLLIWLIGAVIFSISSIIRLSVKEPQYTMDEYISKNCFYLKYEEDLTTDEIDERCEDSYNSYILNQDRDDYYKWISLYTSLANVLVIGGVMFLINKKKTS